MKHARGSLSVGLVLKTGQTARIQVGGPLIVCLGARYIGQRIQGLGDEPRVDKLLPEAETFLEAWPRQRPVASTHRSDATAQQGQRGPPCVAQFARDLQILLFELRSARWVAVVKHECEMDQRIGADMLV